MPPNRPATRSSAPGRSDGRKSMLVYMQRNLIKDLKKVAVEDDRTAYEITEEAVADWLARRKAGRKR